ncbi:MAG: hypothetical protein ACJ76J_01825 [Thermoanaerobaculia bacterium]
MTRKPIVLLAAVAALVLVLAGPARAAGSEPLSPGKAPAALAAAWDWLQCLWSGADLGCDIDPNGRPSCAPVTAQSDHGCGIDPDGSPRCTP